MRIFLIISTIIASSILHLPAAAKRSYSEDRMGIGSLQEEPNLNNLSTRRLSEVARTRALDAAFSLKQLLNTEKLNIVTIESLTAGLIASTLVDIPGEGATLYGGFAVYDTDAKRKFAGVQTQGVYSNKTAQEMAAGALENSRAMVAVAVTGNAMPFPAHKEMLGEVYIGVALRGQNGPLVYAKEIKICDLSEMSGVCDAWKKLNLNGYAPYQITALVADYIRNRTVSEAIWETKAVIEKAKASGFEYGKLEVQDYDMVCKPSWIIFEHISDSNPRKKLVSNSDCEPKESASWKKNKS